MPFERINYVILLVSIVLIVVGFVVMALANSAEDPAHSPLALTVAPLFLVAGYVGAGVAILWRPRDNGAEEDAA